MFLSISKKIGDLTFGITLVESSVFTKIFLNSNSYTSYGLHCWKLSHLRWRLSTLELQQQSKIWIWGLPSWPGWRHWLRSLKSLRTSLVLPEKHWDSTFIRPQRSTVMEFATSCT